MKKSNRNEITAAQAAKTAAMVDEFFDALEPPARQGRTWTFGRLTTTCDDPNAEAVQAVLYPNDGAGFSLYARQGRTLHAVTYHRKPVRFRTIEKALTTLADVPHLDPEIIIDASAWREVSGPV
ncbi:hypothetical protein ACWJKH_00090 (plasmid) [Xanthomonas axonopodis pv. cassiae]|uniref:hypothetical protein n=1 Tax=Xanthomonas TaxID=338 RepID=UPI0004E7695D|nr:MULTISPECIES: hypothetical protein [Xanthomonas]MBV6690422.1 hypothetical protein [Xanthomonas euvesicatoria pv. physalidis]MBV6791770.1 hypothetical protein [Xanthomonas campestris pv. clerodendri]WPM78934.1 hypothetical protein XVT_21850 [Xanthomonas citri pv. viticola]CEI18823.1 conserved hypothetical protein [Xanthomonas citri pv. citri]